MVANKGEGCGSFNISCQADESFSQVPGLGSCKDPPIFHLEGKIEQKNTGLVGLTKVIGVIGYT